MKNIAVLAGGNSSERVISILSAQQIENWLDKSLYNVFVIDVNRGNWFLQSNPEVLVDKNNFSITINDKLIKFDYAYVIIHGDPGENGILQGYLETIGLPHSTCNTLTSSLTFNKFFCNNYLRTFGINIAKSVVLSRNFEYNINDVVSDLGLPVFVKPNSGGSSFGTTKVKTIEDFSSAVYEAFKEDEKVMVEQFIEGTEITVGVFKSKKKNILFPITEIASKNEFFDYEAKYTPGVCDEITPARIPDDIRDECHNLSSYIYDLLDCRGIVRMDYIIKNNELFFLEVNTVPGMSKSSIIPQQAAVYGIEMTDLLNLVIEDTI